MERVLEAGAWVMAPRWTSTQLLAAVVAARSVCLLLLIVQDWLYRDYDSSAALSAPLECLQLPIDDNSDASSNNSVDAHGVSWPGVAQGLRALCTWDCVHFVEVAQCGYQYEHQHAFYPLLPLVRPSSLCTTQRASIEIGSVEHLHEKTPLGSARKQSS